MTRLTAKSSTIFIAAGDRTEIYHSLSDVPANLRRKLQQSLHGANSATLLIADKGGREELVRALRKQSSGINGRVTEKICAEGQEMLKAPRSPSLSFRTWIELLLPIAIGACLWIFIGSRF